MVKSCNESTNLWEVSVGTEDNGASLARITAKQHILEWRYKWKEDTKFDITPFQKSVLFFGLCLPIIRTKTAAKIINSFILTHVIYLEVVSTLLCVRDCRVDSMCVWTISAIAVSDRDIKLNRSLQRAIFFILNSLIIGCSTLFWFTILPRNDSAEIWQHSFAFTSKENVVDKKTSLTYISWWRGNCNQFKSWYSWIRLVVYMLTPYVRTSISWVLFLIL
jgi:hypothetical protein